MTGTETISLKDAGLETLVLDEADLVSCIAAHIPNACIHCSYSNPTFIRTRPHTYRHAFSYIVHPHHPSCCPWVISRTLKPSLLIYRKCVKHSSCRPRSMSRSVCISFLYEKPTQDPSLPAAFSASKCQACPNPYGYGDISPCL